MDEIGLFTALRPDPPAEGARMRAAARDRLEAALGGPTATSWRPRRRRPVIMAAAAIATAAAAIVLPAVVTGGAAGSFVTSAWGVERNPDGTVKITIREMREIFADSAGLKQALQREGIPTELFVLMDAAGDPRRPGIPDSACATDAQHRLEPEAVQRAVIRPYKVMLFPIPPRRKAPTMTWTIRPSAMPPGSALLVEFDLSGTVAYATPPMVVKSGPSPACVPVKAAWNRPRSRAHP